MRALMGGEMGAQMRAQMVGKVPPLHIKAAMQELHDAVLGS